MAVASENTRATTAARFAERLRPLEGLVDVERLSGLVADSPAEQQAAFVTYLDEALFFRSVLAAQIDALRGDAHVIEIGAGIGLLSRLISTSGARVTAYEPESAGFDVMHAISRLFDLCWIDVGNRVTFISEPFPLGGSPNVDRADLVIAVNVIEHVPHPERLIVAATQALAAGGVARFICPNSDFPYEAHFGIPTLVSKRLTGLVALSRIRRSAIPDAQKFWDDLSWPTVRSLRRALRRSSVDASFSREAFSHYAARIDASDFVQRKWSGLGNIVRLARPLIRAAARWMPLTLAPVIDLSTRSRTPA